MSEEKPFIQPGMIYTDLGAGCVALTPEEYRALGGVSSGTERPAGNRDTEIAQLVASLKAQFNKLNHPCWEGVGAHREDDMERLFELLEEEFGKPE